MAFISQVYKIGHMNEWFPELMSSLPSNHRIERFKDFFVLLWLILAAQEKLFIDTVNRTMVEPNRRCYGLPAVNLKKHAVGGILSVTVVSAHGLTRIRHEDSRGESRSSGSSSGHGSSNHTSSNNGGGGSHNGRVRKKFVEITCEDLTRKTHLQDGGTSPVWNETIDMVLHDNTGTVHLNVYEQGPNNVKYDFLGSCEIKVTTTEVPYSTEVFFAVGCYCCNKCVN